MRKLGQYLGGPTENTSGAAETVEDYYRRVNQYGGDDAADYAESVGECRWCHGARYVVMRPKGETVLAGADRLRPCGRCAAEDKQRRWETIGIRAKFRLADWEDVPEMREARRACDELLDGKRWCVFLSAKTGRGKTHLAVATAIEWVERGKGTALFKSAPDLFDELRAAYDPAATHTLNQLLKFYEGRDLLVLDDLGAEKQTEWVAEKLFRIIDARYLTQKATFVTTNEAPTSEGIPYRVRSRLSAGAILVEGGRDWRRR